MAGDWLAASGIGSEIDPAAAGRLSHLRPAAVPKGSVLFRPGDDPAGFVLVLSGRIAVYLTGPNGREILLYTVEPGETCIQTTVGLVGGQAYSGEAVAETDLSVVSIPKGEFSRLMHESTRFRSYVFRAFGDRLGDVTRLLEQVAFVRIDQRLAAALLDARDGSGSIAATHQEIARRIGSVREVVSRKLETFARTRLIVMDRGQIRILDQAGLSRIRDQP
ncbi:MAG: Crp/Fnr family transcriptional regulator [Nitratireductor sp.]|jgi:CRP/FNR family transcriptional regulator|nr:Crp/Fnr family transcriptional regulator [Nitratireductor sp.]